MAITNLQAASPAPKIVYDAHSAMYSAVVTYLIDGEYHAAIGNATTIPGTLDVTHTNSTTVTLVEVARDGRAFRIASDASGAVTEIAVTYEGHVAGVLHDAFEPAIKSQKILYSLDSPPTQIGPNAEGANQVVGEAVWVITENRDTLKPDDDMFQVIGFVNEANWIDPINLDPWNEGTWLYMAPSVTANRDGTFTIQHRLKLCPGGAVGSGAGDAGYIRWRHYIDKPTTVTIDGVSVSRTARTWAATDQIATIQQTAGAGGYPSFSDVL